MELGRGEGLTPRVSKAALVLRVGSRQSIKKLLAMGWINSFIKRSALLCRTVEVRLIMPSFSGKVFLCSECSACSSCSRWWRRVAVYWKKVEKSRVYERIWEALRTPDRERPDKLLRLQWRLGVFILLSIFFSFFLTITLQFTCFLNVNLRINICFLMMNFHLFLYPFSSLSILLVPVRSYDFDIIKLSVGWAICGW